MRQWKFSELEVATTTFSDSGFKMAPNPLIALDTRILGKCYFYIARCPLIVVYRIRSWGNWNVVLHCIESLSSYFLVERVTLTNEKWTVKPNWSSREIGVCKVGEGSEIINWRNINLTAKNSSTLCDGPLSNAIRSPSIFPHPTAVADTHKKKHSPKMLIIDASVYGVRCVRKMAATHGPFASATFINASTDKIRVYGKRAIRRHTQIH